MALSLRQLNFIERTDPALFKNIVQAHENQAAREGRREARQQARQDAVADRRELNSAHRLKVFGYIQKTNQPLFARIVAAMTAKGAS